MNKIEIIEKLIKEGKITFCEALILNEKEYVFPDVNIPSQWQQPHVDWTYRPYQVYCGTSGTTVDTTFGQLHNFKNK